MYRYNVHSTHKVHFRFNNGSTPTIEAEYLVCQLEDRVSRKVCVPRA